MLALIVFQASGSVAEEIPLTCSVPHGESAVDKLPVLSTWRDEAFDVQVVSDCEATKGDLSAVSDSRNLWQGLNTMFPTPRTQWLKNAIRIYVGSSEKLNISYDALYVHKSASHPGYIYVSCDSYSGSGLFSTKQRMQSLLAHEITHRFLEGRGFPIWFEELVANFVEIEIRPKLVYQRSQNLSQSLVIKNPFRYETPLCTNVYDSLFFFGIWMTSKIGDFTRDWVLREDPVVSRQKNKSSLEMQILQKYCDAVERKACRRLDVVGDFFFQMIVSPQRNIERQTSFWQGFAMPPLRSIKTPQTLDSLDGIRLEVSLAKAIYSKYKNEMDFFLIEHFEQSPARRLIEEASDFDTYSRYRAIVPYSVLAINKTNHSIELSIDQN